MSEHKSFSELRKIDVKPYLDNKGKFPYLPWSKAVELLLEEDPTATWKFDEDQWFPNNTVLVSCSVTAFGVTRPMHLPVWETVKNANRSENQAIENPDAFDISNARMRCLTKAIAMFGIGISLWGDEEKVERKVGNQTKKPHGETELASFPEEKAPRFVKTTTSKKEVVIAPPTTQRGQKILEQCELVGVSRKEIEEALGSNIDQINESLTEPLKRFLLALRDDKSRKSAMLKDLYDTIHDIA